MERVYYVVYQQGVLVDSTISLVHPFELFSRALDDRAPLFYRELAEYEVELAKAQFPHVFRDKLDAERSDFLKMKTLENRILSASLQLRQLDRCPKRSYDQVATTDMLPKGIDEDLDSLQALYDKHFPQNTAELDDTGANTPDRGGYDTGPLRRPVKKPAKPKGKG